jgi:hypothetical protein
MAKRRAVIDSDDEQANKEDSPSGAKRSRLSNKDQAEPRSSKSKGKGKARDDNDILNDFRVDDDDDIAAIRDTHAEEDEGAQERFEEEHEESIRESIRQKNKHQGVGLILLFSCSILRLPFDRVQQSSALLNPWRCINLCAISSLPSNSAHRLTLSSVRSIAIPRSQQHR